MLRVASCLAAAALVAFVTGRGACGPPLADLHRLLVSEPALEEELDTRLQAVRLCEAGKEEAVGELLAGRLTLAEAADRFQLLEARRDEGTGRPPRDRAAALRAVIRWASTRLTGGPNEQAEALARLEHELARLAAGGNS
jgi:hypothetical protein